LPTERALVALHGFALVLARAAAPVWPRAGQAALLAPLGHSDFAGALRWADGLNREVARFSRSENSPPTLLAHAA
jgi:hypothetical protein